MRLLLVLLLFAVPLVKATATTSSATSCASIVNLPNNGATQPEQGWYTRAMSTMMRGMIGEMSPSTAAEVGRMVETPEETAGHVWAIFQQHQWVMNVSIVLVVVAVGMLIASIVIISKRCCCPSKDPIKLSNAMMIVTLCCIVVCAIVCIIGAITFLASIQAAKDGLDGIGDKLEGTIFEIGEFFNRYENFMNCENARQQTTLASKLTAARGRVDNAAQFFKDRLEATVDASTKLDAELQNAQLNASVVSLLPAIQQNMTTIRAALAVVVSNLKSHEAIVVQTKATTYSYVTQAEDAIKAHQRSIVQMIGNVKKLVLALKGKLGSALHQVEVITTGIGIGLQASISLPMLLLSFMTFCFVVLFIRFLTIWLKKEGQKQSQAMRMTSKVASLFTAIAGYMALFISVLLFLMAAVCFLIAFSSMFFCLGFFDDPDLLVFEALPSHMRHVQLNNFSYSIHSAFIKCRNDYPFFDALDGSRQMADNALEEKLSQIQSTDFTRRFREFQLNRTKFDMINDMAADTTVATLFPALVVSFQKFEDNVELLVSRATRDQLTLRIDDMVDQLIDDMTNYIADLIKSLLDLSPQCEGMMKIWDQAGGLLCTDIAMPAQGAWMACVICGIGSFCVVHWMFRATDYLKSFVEEDKAVDEGEDLEDFREKRRKKSKSDEDDEKGVDKNRNAEIASTTKGVASTQKSASTLIGETAATSASNPALGSAKDQAASETKNATDVNP